MVLSHGKLLANVCVDCADADACSIPYLFNSIADVSFQADSKKQTTVYQL